MKFVPNDFCQWGESSDDCVVLECDCVESAKKANKRLAEMLNEAPTVFSSHDWEPPLHTWVKMGMAEDVYWEPHGKREKMFSRSTHTAKLVCIEEINPQSPSPNPKT